MKLRATLAALALFAIALVPAGARAAWVMIAEDQHATQGTCPAGLVLASIEAGDADLLVCTPISVSSSDPSSEPAQSSGDGDTPLEGPKFN